MIHIKQTENWVLVDNRFIFTSTDQKSLDYVTCSLLCGEDVIYGEPQKNFINYPWEYQQDDMTIICIMSKDNVLNYVVKWLDVVFAFIQDAKAVNANAFEGVTDVIAFGENVWLQLQKLDLQCNIITL